MCVYAALRDELVQVQLRSLDRLERQGFGGCSIGQLQIETTVTSLTIHTCTYHDYMRAIFGSRIRHLFSFLSVRDRTVAFPACAEWVRDRGVAKQ